MFLRRKRASETEVENTTRVCACIGEYLRPVCFWMIGFVPVNLVQVCSDCSCSCHIVFHIMLLLISHLQPSAVQLLCSDYIMEQKGIIREEAHLAWELPCGICIVVKLQTNQLRGCFGQMFELQVSPGVQEDGFGGRNVKSIQSVSWQRKRWVDLESWDGWSNFLPDCLAPRKLGVAECICCQREGRLWRALCSNHALHSTYTVYTWTRNKLK